MSYAPSISPSAVAREPLSEPMLKSDAALKVADARRLPHTLMADYLKKRAQLLPQPPGLEGRIADRDDFDACSVSVLAACFHECVGGARVTARSASESGCLPLESLCPTLTLSHLYPEILFDQVAHVEVSKLVIQAQFQQVDSAMVLRRLLEHVLDSALLGLKAQIALMLLPDAQSAIVGTVLGQMGVRFVRREVPERQLPDWLKKAGAHSLLVCQMVR